jgi:hypothetical protein
MEAFAGFVHPRPDNGVTGSLRCPASAPAAPINRNNLAKESSREARHAFFASSMSDLEDKRCTLAEAEG